MAAKKKKSKSAEELIELMRKNRNRMNTKGSEALRKKNKKKSKKKAPQKSKPRAKKAK